MARSRRTQRRTRVLAVAVATTFVASLATAVAPSGAAPAHNTAAASGLKLIQVRHSLLGTHTWYQQTYNGVPVYHGWYAKHVLRSGTVVNDGRLAVSGLSSSKAAVSSASAVDAAKAAGVNGAKSTLMVVAGAHSHLVWVVDGATQQALVDAATGKVGSIVQTADYVTGTGKVFDPNPVVALQDETLKDANNSATSVPNSAYTKVKLPNLTGDGTTLTGKYAKIKSAQGGVVTSANRKFNYDRSQDGFEQVMAYHAEDSLQQYIQSLGFTDVNNEQQDFNINTIPDDNSFYSPSQDTITMGRGGVDDAEDIEVIWHESGHAVQDDQVPGYGSSEQAGATGEGFGDYLAMTMSMANSPDTTKTPIACIMDWDSTSYTSSTPHCLRRTDGTKTTDDLDGEVHDDGEIWSRALRDINLAVGREKADTIILEAQFSYSPNNSFNQAATTTYNTAKALRGDLGLTKANLKAIKKAFTDRKITVG